VSPLAHPTLLHLSNFERGTPHEAISALRAQHRLLWQADDDARGGHWLVLQRDDMDHVLRTPEDFSSHQGPLLEDTPEPVLDELRASLTYMDPPNHRPPRRIVDLAVKPQELEARRPLMRQMAKDIIDAVIDAGECEFIEDVALQLPMRILYRLLGVRDEDYERVAALTTRLTLASDPDFAEDRAAGFTASIELIAFGEELAADHRAAPRETLSLRMLEAEWEGRAITDRQFGRLFQNLVVGGVETTRNTLGWFVYEMIRHPNQYAALQVDSGLIPNAVEEILRFRNTVVYLRRTATRDLHFADTQIREGDKLVCILSAANRDAALFPEPDQFDIHRDATHTRRHSRGFGYGPHFCVGHQQARMNLHVMIEEITTRMARLELAESPTHFRSNFMDGFKRMPLRFTSRTTGNPS
jgi:cytochrome P450